MPRQGGKLGEIEMAAGKGERPRSPQRSLADRARGLRATSATPGVTGPPIGAKAGGDRDCVGRCRDTLRSSPVLP